LVKSTGTKILCVLAKNIFYILLKNKIISNLLIFVATKNGRITKFSLSSFGAVVGSGILYPGSGMGKIQYMG
jgi:hypothetical protein